MLSAFEALQIQHSMGEEILETDLLDESYKDCPL